MSEAFDILMSSGDREAWLKARLTGIGASESKVLVLGSFFGKTPYSLWVEKTTGLSDPVTSEAADLGNDLEEWCRKRFVKESGIFVDIWSKLLRSKAVPFMLATPDARGLGPPYVILQVKTAGDASQWDEGIPDHVICQVQHEIFVSGADHAYACVLGGGKGGLRFRYGKIERDEQFINNVLIPKCREFWRCVETNTPPPLDGHEGTSKAIDLIFPKEEASKSVPLDGEFIDLDERLQAIDGKQRELAFQEREIKNKIKAAMGDSEVGVMPNGVTWTWKSQTKREHTVKESTFRVLRRHEK